jgi:hypothetical protein
MFAPSQILTDLLSPIDGDMFFRQHWELAPLHVSRDEPQRYGAVFTRGDVDQLIAYTRPRFQNPSAFDGQSAGRPTYLRGVLSGQPAAPQFEPGLADLRAAYDQGQSVVIMSMHHRWPAIARLCRGLEAVFHCPVHANLYLTPPGSQGFSAHYDPHEVFALQLEGVKHWRLFDRVEPFPLAETVRVPEPPLGPFKEVCLRAGDLLYIPRGHVHDAFTKGESSMHLTVGINVYRWADLLHQAVDCAARRDVKLRQSAPGGALSGSNAGLKQEFQNLLAVFSDSTRSDQLFDAATDSLANLFFSQMLMLPGTQFSSQFDLDLVGLDTVLEKHPQTICRVLENEQGVAIEFPGNRVSGPHRIASALRFIARTARFAVRELPDELNAQAKVVLAKRLVHEGLLTPETTAAGSEIGRGTSERTDARQAHGLARQGRQREKVESCGLGLAHAGVSNIE